MNTTEPRLAALAPDGYRIPTATISRRRLTLLMTISLATLFGWLAYRAAQDTGAIAGHDHEALLWTALMFVSSHQTLLAWLDRPYTVTPEQQALLDLAVVHVSVPLYNESPEIVDRVMYALAIQTRAPQRIVVVDDGTTKHDYTHLKEFWTARFAQLGITCEWHRQANLGKRHAQAVAFRTAGTGFMLTLDSDTALARDAIAEILKPFADEAVWSVAGLEMAYNQTTNLLTRINGMRQLSWQLVQCSALNRFGSILVNRGTFAAYRAALVAESVEAYVCETFLGREVKYSDDSLLTLYALGRGKAVQQVTAHQYSQYAEDVNHALRQWVRWMRGATIRSIWRARYLKPFSYAGFINALNWWQLVASTAAYVYVGIVLPVQGRVSLSAASAAIGMSYLSNVRTLMVKRDDQDGLSQLDTWLLSPLAWAWSLLVLRPIRAYAIATCANNDWGTRKKIEVGELAGAGEHEPAVVGAGDDTVAIGDPVGPATVPIPALGRRRRRGRVRVPLPVAAAGVGAVAVAVVSAGLVASFDRNIAHAPSPAAGAGAHAGVRPHSAGTIAVPTGGRSLTPTGPALIPAAHLSTLAHAASSAPATAHSSATASVAVGAGAGSLAPSAGPDPSASAPASTGATSASPSAPAAPSSPVTASASGPAPSSPSSTGPSSSGSPQ